MNASKHKNIKIEYAYIDSEPISIYFIPRWDNKSYIFVTEDPFEGVSCRVIDKEEKDSISKLIHEGGN